MYVNNGKSETYFLKKVICFIYMEEQFQQKQLNYNTRRKQKRASETERETKITKREERNDFYKRFGCSEVNRNSAQNLMKEEQLVD